MKYFRFLRSLTLSFDDPRVEAHYLQSSFERLRLHARMAILVGMAVYLLCSLLDIWHVPESRSGEVWAIRLTALSVPAIVFFLTFTSVFDRYSQILISSVCMAAGVGLIAIQTRVPIESSAYYYPALVLLTFYTYNFIGARFPYALGIDITLLVAYNLVFGLVMDYPPNILFGHDIFIVSSNLIGGTAGYLMEQQRRLLFLREQELEREREYHWNRSLHDPLTGLPNREFLHAQLSQLLTEPAGKGDCHAGFFLDLDGFKALNDQFGHEVGDQLLREVGSKLKQAVRKEDVVARLGGDEFFILAKGLADKDDACNLAEKLLAKLREPHSAVPEGALIKASIGVCLFPFDGMSASDIIHRADMAMYQAKGSEEAKYVLAELVTSP